MSWLIIRNHNNIFKWRYSKYIITGKILNHVIVSLDLVRLVPLDHCDLSPEGLYEFAFAGKHLNYNGRGYRKVFDDTDIIDDIPIRTTKYQIEKEKPQS